MKTYLTLDVGGSAIKYALMQEDLTILEKSSVPTPMDTLENFIKQLEKSMINFKIKSMVWPFLCLVSLILKEAINILVVLYVILINRNCRSFKEALSNKYYNW
mgnify:CR=1 FL=1